jgi:hypothetical protein
MTSRSSEPCLTESTSSQTLVASGANALFVPFSAFQFASTSFSVIGVPSDQTALGLILISTVWGESFVSSIEST